MSFTEFCPRCGKSQRSAGNQFFFFTERPRARVPLSRVGWKRLKHSEKGMIPKHVLLFCTCAFCKKPSLVQRWKCRCKVEWHSCANHRNCPEEERRKQPVKRRALKKRGTEEWQEVEEATVKRRKVSLWQDCQPQEVVALSGGRAALRRQLPFDIERLPIALRRRLNYPV